MRILGPEEWSAQQHEHEKQATAWSASGILAATTLFSTFSLSTTPCDLLT